MQQQIATSYRMEKIMLVIFILLKFMMPYLLIHPVYELQRDEFLHIDLGRHLAWGYESVPPLTAWTSWLILKLGGSQFWVRFFPALYGALTLLAVWKMVKVLSGNLFALLLSAIAICFSALPRINMLYQPNSFDILAWTLVFLFVICYVKRRENKWIYFAAVSFAVGFLNKYNIIFLAMGLIPALLLTHFRLLFFNKHAYFATALAAIIILPNLTWQYQHNFPVLHHMQELKETQLVHVLRSDFLKEQLLFFFSSLFILTLAIVSFIIYKPSRPYSFVLLCYLFTIAIFLYLQAKGYYAIGLYPVLLAFGSVYFQNLTVNGWKRVFRPIGLIIPILLFLMAADQIFPLHSPEQLVSAKSKPKMHRWENGKEYPLQQDFADMLGWKELAAKTDSAFNTFNGKGYTLILCDNYGEAGAINYYSKLGIQAVSMNADYINWFELDKKIDNVIYAKEPPFSDSSKEKKLFDRRIFTGSIENKFARENGTGIFILSQPKTDISQALRKIIADEKKR